MSKANTPTSKTLNWPAHNRALKHRGSLTIWFDPAQRGRRSRPTSVDGEADRPAWTAKPTGQRGRQPVYCGEADQKTVWGTVFPPNARKHAGAKRRVWRKVHLGIDEQTRAVLAVDVTSSAIGDAPMLPELLSQISPGQAIASVTADGARDTRKCHDAIHGPAVVCLRTTRGAERVAAAVIPPRKTAKPWKAVTAGAVARNEALRASKYLGRALWRRCSGYHRHSRVET